MLIQAFITPITGVAFDCLLGKRLRSTLKVIKKRPNQNKQHQSVIHAKSRPLSYDIPSRAAIFDVLLKTKKAKSADEVAQMFNASAAEANALSRRLRAMLRDGQLANDRSGRYAVVPGSQVVKAKVHIHKNRSLNLKPLAHDADLADVTIGHHQASSLMHGDEIRIRFFPTRRKSSCAIIVAIDYRASKSFVGQLFRSNHGFMIEPTSAITNAQVVLMNQDHLKIADGTFVKVKIIAYPTDRTPCEIDIDSVLGTLDSPSIIQSVMIESFNLRHQFSPESLEQARLIDAKGIVVDADRKDWRSMSFVTIDGADAKDFDDAIFVESLSDGWRVFVAISDVSHYIKPGSYLDKEAYTRGTSVYLPNSVIPMLPFVLSDGLCSLCPDVDRLVKGLEIVLDNQGSVCDYHFCKAVIRSKRRLTYTFAQDVIDQKVVCEPWLKTLLDNAFSVFEVLKRNRVHRGALEIDLPFVHMNYDDHDKIQSISRASRLNTHKIIEELMLLANEVTAAHMLSTRSPALFRNHSKPDVAKLKGLLPFLNARHVDIRAEQLTRLRPKTVAHIISQLSELEHGDYLVPMVLSALTQACYEPINKGHFGLAYKHYCHFTSPIRRYPDLLIHRALDNLIESRQDPILDDNISIKAAGDHCSVVERIADDAQKRASQWLKCCFMMDKVGQVFQATISMVKHFGLFVSIDALLIDGLIHVSALDGFYTFDDETLALASTDHQTTYVIGQTLRVRVIKVNVLNQSIDFELA